MVRSIGLKDYKEELDYIREERANLDLREVGVLEKIKELFNAEAKDFLNGGFKAIKIEKDAHRTICELHPPKGRVLPDSMTLLA